MYYNLFLKLIFLIKNYSFNLQYWEYKLVRSVFLCIFISKQWMNRSIKVLSLPIIFSHLSGNFRIPSRKNDSSLKAIQFWSQFSISAKEVNRWLVASFETISNQKEQCPENTVDAVKHPIWAFPNMFFRL